MRTLSFDEVGSVSGGLDFAVNISWSQVAAGVGIVGLGVAVVATGGLALGPAAAITSSLVAATGVGLAGAGAVVAGTAIHTNASPSKDKDSGGS